MSKQIFKVDPRCATVDAKERMELNASLKILGLKCDQFVVSYIQPHFGNKPRCYVQTERALYRREIEWIRRRVADETTN